MLFVSGGGGWHGLGWLGKGKWDIAVSHLDKRGVCNLCREKLVTIDIDPKDTDMFAESLSKLACQREAKNNEFKRFQVRCHLVLCCFCVVNVDGS